MSRQLLDRPRWGAAHRQVRTERVSQPVYAADRQLCSLAARATWSADHVLRERGAVSLTEHPLRSQVSMLP